MSFFSRVFSWLQKEPPQQPIQPQVASTVPAAVAPPTLAPPPAQSVAAGTSFPNRAAFDAWLATTPISVAIDYAWVKKDGFQFGAQGYYTQPDGSVTTTPAPAVAIAAPPPAVTPPTVVVPPPVAIPPPPAEQLQPLHDDLLRDVLLLCAVSAGGPLTPAYRRAQAQLGDHLNTYINAYRGQLKDYDFYKPMEHTGMLLSAWDPARTPPNYVRAIGGMTPEQFESIKSELVALGYAV